MVPFVLSSNADRVQVHEIRGALEQVVEVHCEGLTSSVRMGKVRRGGYIIKWFIGDHPPRHVHVCDSDEKPIGRLNLETLTGLEGWQPSKKLLHIIADLQREGRL